MKKIIAYSSFLLIMVMVSCTKNISRFNEETKNPANVPAETLFSNAIRNVVDGITTPNVNDNVFRFTVQHWGMATYQDEVNYDFTTRAIPERWWARMYRDVLADFFVPGRENKTVDPKRGGWLYISVRLPQGASLPTVA